MYANKLDNSIVESEFHMHINSLEFDLQNEISS